MARKGARNFFGGLGAVRSEAIATLATFDAPMVSIP